MTVKPSSVDLIGRSMYCLSLMRQLTNFKHFADHTKAADTSILRGDEHSPTLLKIRIQPTPFIDRETFLLQATLNNLARLGDHSGLIFIRITVGILFRPVAFLQSRLLVSLETSRVVLKMP